MAWKTPKTDWYGVTNPSDGVYTGDRFNAVDFNRIKNNLTYLGECYIQRGYINKDEYENLHDYLYLPYKKLGGNGTAEKIMKEVDRLSLKDKED